MSEPYEVAYDRRSVKEWVNMAQSGRVVLTDFQRSFVWTYDRTAKYIMAIFSGKPIGLYLILKKSDPPQFEPRNFNQFDAPLENVKELVLDGQQRLTSLLQALYRRPPNRRYFLKFSDLAVDDLNVINVVCEQDRTAKEFEEPAAAYQANFVPIDILRNDPDDEGLTPLAHWCLNVAETVGPKQGRILETKIKQFVDDNFFDRLIWYCSLPASIDRSTATEIFVETNTSSVRIKRFDVEVANARGIHDEDLRQKIQDAYERPENAVFRHYFREDPEDWIPEIGEWMLKVACLRAGHAPRETNYCEALKYLLKSNNTGEFLILEKLPRDLSRTLDYAAEHGAATRRTMPSWPPLHVLAALRPEIDINSKPEREDLARRLLKAYYWRCLFSNRHDVQANDRLHADFKTLQKALKEIHRNGSSASGHPVFDTTKHPLYDADYLYGSTPWIGSSSRLGRALVSVVMASTPPDWVTGHDLNQTRIRELENSGDLDRHHVFSRDALKKAKVSDKQIQNGLNGVLLDGRTNKQFSKSTPGQYLAKVIKSSKIKEMELRARVEKHIVPYDEIKNANKISASYEVFLKNRAKMLADRIKVLSDIGGPG